MRLSNEGLAALKFLEGFREEAYLDSAGVPTIGYGTTKVDGGPVKMGSTISKEKAEECLSKDITWAEDVVNQKVTVETAQNEFDALVIETYNIGDTAFKESTFLKRHNAGDKAGCAEAMQWWNKITVNGKKVVSEGLKNRRRYEANIYLDGEYPV